MLERHQWIAVLIAFSVTAILWARDGQDRALAGGMVLLASLVPILFYRLLAWLAGFGFPEVFAKDYGSGNHPAPYAVFFWLLFLIVAAFLLFDWRLY